MIAAPWIVSLAISSPIALGLNRTPRRSDTPRLCTFYNSDFLIYSSMGSFYVPTVVMIVLYWRVYVAIRSRRSVSTGTSSGRSRQTRTGDESVSYMVSAAPPPSTMNAHPGHAAVCAAADPASDGDPALSVAATLSAVQRRGEELALRVAAVTASDRPASLGGTPPPGDAQSRAPLPAIAVVDTDDVAVVFPPTSNIDGSVRAVSLTPAVELIPASLSPVSAVDSNCAELEDRGTVDSGRTDDSTPELTCSGWSTATDSTTLTQRPSDTVQDTATSDCESARRPVTHDSLLVPPARLYSRTALLSVEASMRFRSDVDDDDDDDGETVLRAAEMSSAMASPPPPVDEQVNGGRFVTFFNFAPKQQRSTATAAATSGGADDRRLKRAVRRERRATKTLAIVLGNLFFVFYETRTHFVLSLPNLPSIDGLTV